MKQNCKKTIDMEEKETQPATNGMSRMEESAPEPQKGM